MLNSNQLTMAMAYEYATNPSLPPVRMIPIQLVGLRPKSHFILNKTISSPVFFHSFLSLSLSLSLFSFPPYTNPIQWYVRPSVVQQNAISQRISFQRIDLSCFSSLQQFSIHVDLHSLLATSACLPVWLAG